jgi:phosphate starvation-inducible PhoH-like protein
VSLKQVKLKPKTRGQKNLLKTLRQEDNIITMVFGPTGSGKSLFIIAYAIDAVLQEKYQRLVITKPIVDVEIGKELTVKDLGDYYQQIVKSYLMDLMSPRLNPEKLEELINKKKIEFADTHYLRGRTFDDTLLFIDDAQNVPIESVLEIMARVGLKSRLFVAADPVFQYTSEKQQRIQELRELLASEKGVALVDLGLADIVRPGAKKAVKLLLEERMRKRKLSLEEEKIKTIIRKHAPDSDVVTVLDLRIEKTRYFANQQTTIPDALIIVKEGHHGRTIGKEGERIKAAEEELGLSLRVAEASLELFQLLKAIHPTPLSFKNVSRVDMEGANITIYVSPGKAGPLLGQRWLYIKFAETVIRKLLGIGIIVREEEA